MTKSSQLRDKKLRYGAAATAYAAETMEKHVIPKVIAIFICGLVGCADYAIVLPSSSSFGENDTAQAADSGGDSGLAANSSVCPGADYSGAAIGEIQCENGICEIPGGAFVQGADDPFAPDSCPWRWVTLGAFAIDETEVTRKQWGDCVRAGVCEAQAAACLQRLPDATPADAERLPASCLTYAQAEAVCAFRGGRLPTEAEWEHAARGREGAVFPWGSSSPTCNRANFRFASSFCAEGPVPVASYPERSPYGLRDTSGNVWEWTADNYDFAYYSDAPDTNPPGPERCREGASASLGACRFRVLRGGSFLTTESTLRTFARSPALPDTIDESIGVRCAFDRLD